MKEGIVFAFYNQLDETELSIEDDNSEKFKLRVRENYAKEQLRRPEYQRIRIGLERLNRILVLIKSDWRNTRRQYTLKELENILYRQHKIEKEADKIDDEVLRGYIHEQLDMIAAVRRLLSEEIRWDWKFQQRT